MTSAAALPFAPEEPKNAKLKRLFSCDKRSKQDRLEIAQIFRTSNFGFSNKHRGTSHLLFCNDHNITSFFEFFRLLD